MKTIYQKTIYASFVGYIIQAVINNFAPLLFLTFQTSYNISLSKITMLVTVNFGLQLVIDLLAVGFVDKIGYRISIVASHVFSAVGLVALTFLPELFSDPFIGLLISVVIYAVGGGLLEVLISPIVEACPSENKEKTMSLLHSFYCWGQVGVVLFSTVFFTFVGIGNWKILALIWAIIPVINGLVFCKVPIVKLVGDDEQGLTIQELFKNKMFWILMLIMLCAGASEQSVSQWASTFAQLGLGVNKTIGDLAGPMVFAAMMGISRVFYGKYGHKINLNRFMILSAVMCIVSYLIITLTPGSFFGLLGLGLCGLSVGILWPGTFSSASAAISGGGTSMFALLALAGDLGCSAGPTLVGLVSGAANDNLKIGILIGLIFPITLVIGFLIKRKHEKISI